MLGDNTHGQSDNLDGQFQAVSASRSYACGLDIGDRIRCRGNVGRVPVPVGVGRVSGSYQPDPAACRPFGASRLTAGFPLNGSVPSTTGTLRVAVLFVDFANPSALNSAKQESLKGPS